VIDPVQLERRTLLRLWALAILFLFAGGLVAVQFADKHPQPTPAVGPAPDAAIVDEPAAEEHSVLALPAPPDGLPGHTGYIPNPEKTEEFLNELEKPFIRQAGPELFRGPRGPPEEKKGVLLYRPFYRAYKKTYGQDWKCGSQGIGDCVSWGWHHGVAIATAVEFELGNISEWKLPATEAIYGLARVEGIGRSSGGWSDGAYGGGAAKGVSKFGILFREPYEKFDLTKYSADRAKQWGNYGCGGKGDNGWADTKAKEHPVKQVALVRTFAEAAAAIDSGFPVPVCSGQGFASRRDEQGFARGSGSWSHCMCFIATRYDRPGLLCLNSWGTTWISGPKWPDDQPEGSFWVDAKTAESMLRGNDSFAVSAVEGFPFRPLDNGDWVFLPAPHVPDDAPEYVLAP
jgi:hypothetical protein